MREHPASRTLRLDWPYDDALAWMAAARGDVAKGATMRVGAGSHREEVVTLGRHTPETQVRAADALQARGIQVRRVERGGGATAHGPGQLVLYPVVDLARLGSDIPRFTRTLEEVAKEVLAAWGIRGECDEAAPGVYVAGAKIASLGFRVEAGVVTHGLALNVCNDLSLFDLIDPCGRVGQRVTSMQRERPDVCFDLAALAMQMTSLLGRICVLGYDDV